MLCNIESSRLARLSYILSSDPNIEENLRNNVALDNLDITSGEKKFLQQMLKNNVSLKKLLSQFSILGTNANWWG